MNLQCYANTNCDGRDSQAPTASPAPNGGNLGDTMDVCTVCGGSKTENALTIQHNGATTTCGDLNWMLSMESVQRESDECSAMQDTHAATCCFDECHVCQKADGGFLDIKTDLVVQKGGYSATCGEVNDILLASTEDDEDTCSDARDELVEECCYEQCTLCGHHPDATTEWYATVKFGGLTTTCLGLDYMLRNEQLGVGSDKCLSVRKDFVDECCYIPPEEPCRLCEADAVLYGLDDSAMVAAGRSSATCERMHESFLRLETSSQECTKAKQTYFGGCCDLSTVVTLEEEEGEEEEEDGDSYAAADDNDSSGKGGTPSVPSANPPKGPGGPGSPTGTAPSPSAVTGDKQGDWWKNSPAPTVGLGWNNQGYSFNWVSNESAACRTVSLSYMAAAGVFSLSSLLFLSAVI